MEVLPPHLSLFILVKIGMICISKGKAQTLAQEMIQVHNLRSRVYSTLPKGTTTSLQVHINLNGSLNANNQP